MGPITIFDKESIKPCLFIIPIGKCLAEVQFSLEVYKEGFWFKEFLTPIFRMKDFKNFTSRIRRVRGAFEIEMFEICKTSKFQDSLIIFLGFGKIPRFKKPILWKMILQTEERIFMIKTIFDCQDILKSGFCQKFRSFSFRLR